MSTTIRRLAVSLALAFVAGCGGGGSAVAPSAPAPAAPVSPAVSSTAQTANVNITVVRGGSTASNARTPQYISPAAKSVEMDIYVGALAAPAAGTAFAPGANKPYLTTCVNFGAQSSANIVAAAPLGADTIVVSSFDGPCTGLSGPGTVGTGNLLSQGVGSGTVTAAGGTVASIFTTGSLVSGGNASLTPTVAASGTVLLAVNGGTATAAPAAASLSTLGSTASVVASELNYTGAFTAVSSATAVATVAGTAPNFTVTAVGVGSSTITITDAAAKSASVTVTVTAAAAGALQASWTIASPLSQFAAVYSATPSPAPTVTSQPATSGVLSATPANLVAVPSQSVTFTVAEAGNTAGFTGAVAGCPAGVTVTGPTSNQFTLSVAANATPIAPGTAAAPACVFNVTSTSTGKVVATQIGVAAVQNAISLLWVPPGYTPQTQPPFNGSLGPINLAGTGATFTAGLYAAQTNWNGTYTATVTCPAGSSGIQVANVTTISPIAYGTFGASATTVAGSTAGLIGVTAASGAASPSSSPCTIGVQNSAGVPTTAPTISVTLTQLTGILQ